MAAAELLGKIKVQIVEYIVVNELCEWNGRQNFEDSEAAVTSLVRTTSVDGTASTPRRRFFFFF